MHVPKRPVAEGMIWGKILIMSRYFLYFIVTLLLTATIYAQNSAAEKEVDLGFLQMKIPALLLDKKIRGVDGGAYRYEGEGLTLDVDYNPDCYRPTFERRDPAYDYAEEALSIDGIRAKIWSIRGGRFMAGANYGTMQGKIGLGIYLSGDDNQREKIQEIARKIFLSVKVTPRRSP